MAALVEGCQYGLSSLASTSAGKSVLHVKLTDSALKAIEEFQKIQRVLGQRPSIQFTSDRGEIKVPLRKSEDNPDGYRKFHFSLSSIQGEPQDCIQQDAADEQLSLLGTMSQKLVVKATDDVYKTTKARMTLAKEEDKKSCAKEIKPGSSVRKVVKKVVRRSAGATSLKENPVRQSASTHSAITQSHVANNNNNRVSIKDTVSTHSQASRPGSLPLSSLHDRHQANEHRRSSGGTSSSSSSLLHPSPTAGSQSRGGERSKPGSSSSSSSSSRHSSPAPGSKPSSSSNLSPSQSSHQSHPSSSSSSSKPLQNITMTTKPSNPAIMNTPLRDRIIHLLALRPYKKLELWTKLQKEGVRDRDRTSFGSLLTSVSQFNHRDNSLSLARHIYQELRVDWPFYTEEERTTLRRKLAQEQGAASRTPSPAISPVHSNGSQAGSPSSSTAAAAAAAAAVTSASTAQKRRSSSTDAYDYTSSKKQRIAHDPRRSSGREEAASTKVVPPLPVKQEATSSTCESSLTVASQSRQQDYQEKENKDYTIATPSPERQDASSQDTGYSAEPSSTSDTPEYVLKYTRICDGEQRRQYKADFSLDYEVYTQIHANLDKEMDIFRKLRERLKMQEEGTEDFEKTKNIIFSEYHNLKSDPKYVDQRRQCDFLHRKLGHIKKLIVEFDTAVHSTTQS